MTDLKNKRVISVAITGSWPTRKDNPNLSITPEEIAEDVYECWKAGAAVAHIHVRDDEGNPSTDFEIYKRTIELIREKKDCDILLNITSSGSVGYGDEERIYPLTELMPEMASFDAGTLNWQHRTIFENSPSFLEKLGKALTDKEIKPEIEIFHEGMIYEALHYEKIGAIKAPLHFQFVLGVPGGVPATVGNLAHLVSLLPEGSTWGGSGVGKGYVPILFATIAMGGHIRLGFEDNVFYHKGVLADSNAQLVQRAVRLLEEAGLEAAKPDEAREIFNLRIK